MLAQAQQLRNGGSVAHRIIADGIKLGTKQRSLFAAGRGQDNTAQSVIQLIDQRDLFALVNELALRPWMAETRYYQELAEPWPQSSE